MDFGLYLRSFMSDPARPLYEQIDETARLCHVAEEAGFAAVTMPQHWVSYPTVWPSPLPVLARLAPETGNMRLLTGIILLPLHNPVEVAEAVSTLDHITHGRFTFGVGLGYRETELEAVGATRKDRVPRLRESLEIMRLLWTGEEVSYEGRYWKLRNARMGFTPVQQPHPPVWIASQSPGAARRAAQIADGLYLAPQVGLDDLRPLIEAYRDEAAKQPGPHREAVAVTRGVSFSSSRAAAIEEARTRAESSYRMYSTWDMQEETMVRIHISSESRVEDWAVTGGPQECLEQFGRLRDELGVDYAGLTFYNLPKGEAACAEYLQRFGEQVIKPLGKR